MISVGKIGGAGAAAQYFTATDDYYSEGDTAPSKWMGIGAEALGLEGEVARSDLLKVLEGHLPDGSNVGREVNGEWVHRPGWDVVVSAPKEISLLSQVFGDERFGKIFREVADRIVEKGEGFFAETRVRDGERVMREHTGNFIIASFDHETSRAQDPQTHVHYLVMNATAHDEGWRSVESLSLMRGLKSLSLEFHAELGREIEKLGYRVAYNENGHMYMPDVPRNLVNEFSSRSKEITEYLTSQNIDSSTANDAQRNVAAQASRDEKVVRDRDEMRAEWIERANNFAFSIDDLTGAAERRAAINKYHTRVRDARQERVEENVSRAIRELSSRDARFAETDIIEKSQQYGGVLRAEAENRIDALVESGSLIAANVQVWDQGSATMKNVAGYSTPEGVAAENRMLDLADNGKDRMRPVVEPNLAADAVATISERLSADGTPLTKEQQIAFGQLLSSSDRFMALQGYASGERTAAALSALTHYAQQQGMKVSYLAPSDAAALNLGNALGVETKTVGEQLGDIRQTEFRWLGDTLMQRDANRLWVIDKAGFLSTQNMLDVMDSAKIAGARVIFMDDRLQASSFQAGSAFGLLQDAGLTTAVLADTKKQDGALLDAVKAASRMNSTEFYRNVEASGGEIQSVNGLYADGEKLDVTGKEARYATIAQYYLSFDKEQRSNIIVIDPTRAGGEAITNQIREGLRERGDIGGKDHTFKALRRSNVSEVDRETTQGYAVGDQIRMSQGFVAGDNPVLAALGLGSSFQRDDYATVTGVDAESGRIQVENNRNHHTAALRPDDLATAQVFKVETMSVAVGETIRLGRRISDPETGDVEHRAGAEFTIKAIDADKNVLTVETNDGKIERLDLNNSDHTHLKHTHVDNMYSASLQEAERAIIHLESFNQYAATATAIAAAASAATKTIDIVTDDAEKLAKAIDGRSGQKTAATNEQGAAETVRAVAQWLDEKQAAVEGMFVELSEARAAYEGPTEQFGGETTENGSVKNDEMKHLTEPPQQDAESEKSDDGAKGYKSDEEAPGSTEAEDAKSAKGFKEDASDDGDDNKATHSSGDDDGGGETHDRTQTFTYD